MLLMFFQGVACEFAEETDSAELSLLILGDFGKMAKV